MNSIFLVVSPGQLFAAMGVAALAGMIKGVVGFGMPTFLVLGLGVFLDPGLALAGLILPTLVTNGMQALREGARAALNSVGKFRVFLITGLVFLLASAQLVPGLSDRTLLLMIGVPVLIFTVFQLVGVGFSINGQKPAPEAVAGALAGIMGGISGVWGPPTVTYLTATNTPKTEQMRVQGVIFGLGAPFLLLAHIGSGVVRAETFAFSLALVPAAVLGMWAGGVFQNRIDQATFRKFTLIVLLFAGLNLVRRALLA